MTSKPFFFGSTYNIVYTPVDHVEKRRNIYLLETGNNSTGSLEKSERNWNETKTTGWNNNTRRL